MKICRTIGSIKESRSSTSELKSTTFLSHLPNFSRIIPDIKTRRTCQLLFTFPTQTSTSSIKYPAEHNLSLQNEVRHRRPCFSLRPSPAQLWSLAQPFHNLMPPITNMAPGSLAKILAPLWKSILIVKMIGTLSFAFSDSRQRCLNRVPAVEIESRLSKQHKGCFANEN